MTDTKNALRILDDVPAPSLWERIEAGEPRPDDPEPARPVWKRVVPVAIAAAITAAIVFVLSSAFRTDDPSTPAVPPVPTVGPVANVTLGAPEVLPIDTEGLVISSAQEAFGSLWTIEEEELQRRDKQTGAVQATFPIVVQGGGEWGGEGIEIGAGRVWVTAFEDATVYSIDPATDDVTSFALDGKVVSDLAIDADGQVWASVSSHVGGEGEAKVFLLDPATGQATAMARFEADWWGGLYPIDATVWTLERTIENSTVQGGTLVQVTPGTASSVDVGGSFAMPVSDGTVLWTPFFGDAKGMNLASGIARVDPKTGDVLDQWRTDPLGYDIAVGADGGIWFLAESGLQRLNPATGTVDVRARVDGTPIYIAPATDGVWVATYEGDLVFFPFIEQPTDGTSQVVPAQPGERSYLLSDFAVEYPWVNHNDVDRGTAGVAFDVSWTTDLNPGTTQCLIQALGEDGSLVGELAFQLTSNTSGPEAWHALQVPVAAEPVSATGHCAKAPEVYPNAGYEFSDLRIDVAEGKLVGTIRWVDGVMPGEQLCRAAFEQADGTTETQLFTLAVGEGADQTITSIPEKIIGATPTGVTCEAFAGQPDKSREIANETGA